MPPSLNSVIHYTDTFAQLSGIIEEKFKVKYYLEKVIGTEVAFPMVSFCDIPLSQISHHASTYGDYGILKQTASTYLNEKLARIKKVGG